MARFIVLAVDDNSVADALMAKLAPLSPKVTIVGLFGKPRLFCTCKGSGKGKTAYTRGIKLGWWVCVNCHKPSRGWGSNPQAVISQGVNLLEGTDA